jgi:hypothetical protein
VESLGIRQRSRLETERPRCACTRRALAYFFNNPARGTKRIYAMPDAHSSIPLPTPPNSDRAVLQALAERVELLVPGASLSHQQIAFAKGVVDLVNQGRVGGGRQA